MRLPRAWNQWQSEASHSAVLAAPETELIPQIFPLAVREALAHAMTTAVSHYPCLGSSACCVWVAYEARLPAFGLDHRGLGTKSPKHPCHMWT